MRNDGAVLTAREQRHGNHLLSSKHNPVMKPNRGHRTDKSINLRPDHNVLRVPRKRLRAVRDTTDQRPHRRGRHWVAGPRTRYLEKPEGRPIRRRPVRDTPDLGWKDRSKRMRHRHPIGLDQS